MWVRTRKTIIFARIPGKFIRIPKGTLLRVINLSHGIALFNGIRFEIMRYEYNIIPLPIADI